LGGSYIDKKWQLDFFEEFKMVGFTPDSDQKNKKLNSSVLDFSLKDIERNKLNAKMDLSSNEKQTLEKLQEETGQTALKLSSSFHERVLFIKRHLEQSSHPISQII